MICLVVDVGLARFGGFDILKFRSWQVCLSSCGGVYCFSMTCSLGMAGGNRLCLALGLLALTCSVVQARHADLGIFAFTVFAF